MKKLIGFGLLITSFIMWGGVAVLPFLMTSSALPWSLIPSVAMVSEGIFLISIGLLGKDLWQYLKSNILCQK